MATSGSNTMQLEQLRRTIQSLESYKLPDHFYYLESAGGDENSAATGMLEQSVLQRYTLAKQSYIRQRFEEIFLQHVATYNGETFQLPQTNDDEEMVMKESRQELRERLLTQVNNIVQKRKEVLLKYAVLQEKKEELKYIVEDLATKHGEEEEEDEEVDDDEEVTEEELEGQQRQMEQLLSKKLELEAKLATLKVDTKHLEGENEHIRQEYNTLHGGNSTTISKPVWDSSDTCDAATDEIQKAVVELQQRMKEGEDKIQEIQNAAIWYNAMRSTLCDLSGIRVLNISSLDTDRQQTLVILFQLLDEFTLQVELQPLSKKTVRQQHCLRVSNASLKGDLVIGEGATQVRIPPLDDLVAISRQLPHKEDLRFILREAIARIRALRCRVDELVRLRKQYAMTIENEGEKLYCSLNEGVTAVLRLSADCPMLKGSAFVDQLIGTGGWDAKELEMIRTKLNSGDYKGAVQVMDALVAEIKSFGYQQKTPHLPVREMR